MANHHLSPFFFLLLLRFAATITCQTLEQCLLSHTPNNTNFLLLTPSSPSYNTTLRQTLQNLRFSSTTPSFILLPILASHVSSAVVCSRLHGLRLAVRSGGHDYEGLSYRPQPPSLLLDLSNMTTVRFDGADSAWVDAGATIGDLYYAIAKRSSTLGFPAGLCPQVGIGGLLGGGGIGTLMRKYGLAVDNAVDALLVDANGRLLNRASMGEDLFWAIRGGGASSFGVVVSWKVKLVAVPPTVTTFAIFRMFNQSAISLVHQWQTIAPNLPEDLFLRVVIRRTRDSGFEQAAKFHALYLGRCNDLVALMARTFPALAMGAKDCNEMSWAQSTLYFAGHKPNQAPLEALLERGWSTPKGYFKGKSDFVLEPISEQGLSDLWRKAAEEDGSGMVIMDPWGGRVSAAADAELAFPHRKGVLYNVQYLVQWNRVEDGARHMRWAEELYRLMGPVVSKAPRRAYLNYRDMEIGDGNGRYFGENGWGRSYFLGNAERLVEVKGRVDPGDFFRSQQSVPLPPARSRHY